MNWEALNFNTLRIFTIVLVLQIQSIIGQESTQALWSIVDNRSLNQSVRNDALGKLFVHYTDHYEYDSARVVNDIIQTRAEKSNDAKMSLRGVINSAWIFREQRNFHSSVTELLNIIPLAQRVDDANLLAIILTDLVTSYRITGNLDSARLFSQQLNNLAQKNPSPYLRASAFWTDADITMEARDFESAVIKWNDAVVWSLMSNDTVMAIEAMINASECYDYLSNSETGIANSLVALALSRKLKNRVLEAKVHSAIGYSYYDIGEYPTATQYFQNSVSIYDSLHLPLKSIPALGQLAIMRFRLGDFETSEKSYINLIEICQNGVALEQLAGAKANLSAIYYSQGKMNDAINLLISAVADYIASKERRQIGLLYNNIGEMYREIGQPDSAMVYLQRSLEIAKRDSITSHIAIIHNTVGDVYLDIGNNDSALHHLKKAEEISSDHHNYHDKIHSVRSLYTVYYRAGAAESAFEQLSAIINYSRRGMEVNFPVMSEKEKELYFATLGKDFEIQMSFAFKQSDEFPGVTDAVLNNTLQTKGLLLKSSSAMRNTILKSGDSSLINRYNEWIEIRIEIARRFANNESLMHMQERANEMERELAKRSSAFINFNEVLNITWQAVIAGLDKSHAIIEFVTFPDSADFRMKSKPIIYYGAIVVRPGWEHPKLIKLFPESTLEKILGTFPGNNISYIQEIYGTKENTKSQLYDLIWKPIEDLLDGVEKVYVSPAGLLHKISFPALSKEQDIMISDVYDVEMRSSVCNISPDPDKQNSSAGFQKMNSCSIFGGIDYNFQSGSQLVWHYLEGSLTEIKKIQHILLKTDQIVHYFDLTEATEGQFKKIASQSNTIHIATHGFFFPNPEDELTHNLDTTETIDSFSFRSGTTGMGVSTFVKNENPLMRSGLVFAGANNVWNQTMSEAESDNAEIAEDGVLTAQEVATIDMRKTNLVVLSACETGLGDIKGSEGVYGLQRAFKMAGVKYIIMSLWQVPDKETAEFMTTFYKNLTKTNDIRKSFNLTQRTMREKYDPYYWGAFVLIE